MSRITNRQLVTPFVVAAAFCAVGLAALSSSTLAADAPGAGSTPGGSTSDSELKEIVVTAEKRESTVQKTPISMTAISGEKLSEQGITSMEQMVEAVPGVSMRSGGPGQTEYEMRGLTSEGGAAPTVGIYLDETPMSPPANSLNGKVVIDPDLYDVNRVEVLRGPQGTLYGSGSMGGTIKVITNSARLNTFEGSVDVGVSGTQGAGANPNVSGMLNLPLVADKVALRIVATDKYTSGWIDRIVVNPFPLPTNNGCTPTLLQGCNAGNIVGSPIAKEYSGVNWTRLKGARASLFIQATDQLTIDMGVFWQQLKAGGYSQYDAESGITPIGGQLAHYQAFDESEPFGDTFELYHLTIGYDFGFAKLTSATGYWERTEDQNQDESQATQNILFLSAFVPAIANETDQSHQISQELRLASEGDSRFQWIGGLFYARLLSDYNFTQINPSLCYFAVGGCAADPAGIAGLWRNPYTIDQYAVFGESSYKFTDTLKLTVGARYYDFSNRLNYVGDGFLNPTGNANPYTGSVSSRNSGVNPKVNLSYMPDDSLTLYSTIEKGFRPGGVNLPVPVSGAYSCLSSLHAIGLDSPILQYGPDSIWSYEVGEKARLLDGRLVINSDVYYTRWNHIQLANDLACGYPYTSNAGNAETYGPELEIAIDLGAGFTLSANGTYTHAQLTAANATSGYAVGDPILNIPKYTESTTLTYTSAISEGYKLKSSISNSLVGPQYDEAFVKQELPSYNISNLRFVLQASRWTGSLFINNLANKVAALSINNTTLDFNIPDLTRVTTNQPRTYGADLQYRF